MGAGPAWASQLHACKRVADTGVRAQSFLVDMFNTCTIVPIGGGGGRGGGVIQTPPANTQG